MQQLTMHTPDLTQANIDKIAQIFPHVVTEAEDEDGKLTRKIDFDLLRQSLSKDLIEDTTERYRLDRPGKKRALLKANTPLTKTLRPVPEDSVNRDTTENLYLEGDNFEILKILQESYLGKIKMIYIDPPYNTGKDFVYRDDFKVSKSDYESELGAVDEEGGKLFKNTDTNGRYHSDRLSMMYSRLTIARDLLKDDGVIFMSIDDNEVHNLIKIGDEIFGEENRSTVIHRRKNRKPHNAGNTMSLSYEFILVYYKDNVFKFSQDYSEMLSDENGNYAIYPVIQGDKKIRTYIFKKGMKCDCENLIKGEIKAGRNSNLNIEILDTPVIKNNILMNDIRISGRFRLTDENGKLSLAMSENRIFINSNGFPKEKRYRNEEDSKIDNHHWDIEKGKNEDGNDEIKDLFDLKGDNYIFSYPKPIALLVKILEVINDSNAIILDFFSGSATTAHAVMQLNAEDGGNRKFIMAQLPEETDTESEAHKAGYKYITEIGKERIRRAGKKILEDNKDKEGIENLDIGFRVYRTDTTNMKDVYYHPSQIKQSDLGLFTSNIKDDRTPHDLLTQVMLDRGHTLDLPMRENKIGNNTVFYVAENSLVACFDEKIDMNIIDQIAECKPVQVVFRDACFNDVADRINVETRIKRLSPDTQISVI